MNKLKILLNKTSLSESNLVNTYTKQNFVKLLNLLTEPQISSIDVDSFEISEYGSILVVSYYKDSKIHIEVGDISYFTLIRKSNGLIIPARIIPVGDNFKDIIDSFREIGI